MAALQPDLLGLQEVVYVMQQDRLIGAAGEGRYGAVRGWAGRPEYGNSLLVKEPLTATQVDRLDLGLGRSAHRAVVALPGGATLLVVVTHLHHTVDGDQQRDEQAAALLGWLDGGAADRCDGRDGRLQCRSGRAHLRADARGRVRSAYAEANGAEPAVTWPSGLQAPAMDTDGDPDCLDYIWLRGAVRVDGRAARLRPARPARPDRSTRSDHLGISAHLEIG